MLDLMTPTPYRIVEKWPENHDCFSIRIVPEEGKGLENCRPGQFNMLYLFGVGEAPISISRIEGESIVHTIRAVGSVTKGIRFLGQDSVIGVRGPFGQPWPLQEAKGKDLVLMAGGIGLAPLRPVIHHYLSHQSDYGRLILLYGARTPKDLLFQKEMQALCKEGRITSLVTVDQPSSNWPGHVGLVTGLVTRAGIDPKNSLAMICGPEIMMRFCAERLVGRGLERENIYVSMEKNMKCGIGICGHCQCGPHFVCKDGPVFNFAEMEKLLNLRGI